MRRAAPVFLIAIVSACAQGVSAQQMPLPGGGVGYDLRCPGGSSACVAKAEELCTGGHDVLEAASSGQLLVKCRGGPASPPPPTNPAAMAAVPSERTPEQLVRAARQSLYLVGTPAGQGTGFCIRGGRIVTSLELVMGHSIIFVTDAQGQRRQVGAVRSFDSDRDLAVLDVGAKLSPALELAPPEMPKAGAKVVVLANQEAAPANGVIGGERAVSAVLTLLQIDAPIPPGSSGGPVLNAEGKVAAMLLGAPAAGNGHGFALPVRYLRESLASTKGLITMSTFAAITAPAAPPPRWAPIAKKQSAFPISIAGFAFGMSIPDAQQACAGKLTGAPSFATCPFEPVDVKFANNNVSIRFERGRLTRVYLRGNSWDDVTSAMLAKYGKPNLVEARNGGGFDPSATWKKGTASRATWWLDGGTLVVFSQDGRDLALIYTVLPADEPRDTTPR